MADDVVFQSATPATAPVGTRVVGDEMSSPYSAQTGIVQATKVLSGEAGGSNAWQVETSGAGKVNQVKGTSAFTDPACDTTADLLLAANTSRKVAIIQNAGTVDCFIGPSGVTTSSGLSLTAGASFVDAHSTSAWYGITASGTADIRVCEIA